MKRDVYLYLEPREESYGKPDDFAQCRSCPMWAGAKHNVCSIHGKEVEVTGDMTCGLYVNGKPTGDIAYEHAQAYVTPAESGLEKREVRCENCGYYSKGNCRLFQSLGLPSKVYHAGCCNANTRKPVEITVVGEKPNNKFFKKA